VHETYSETKFVFWRAHKYIAVCKNLPIFSLLYLEERLPTLKILNVENVLNFYGWIDAWNVVFIA